MGGKAIAFNFLTVTKTWRWPLQRLGLLLAKSPQGRAQRFSLDALPTMLKDLDFLYSARWVDVGRFPRVEPGQRREDWRLHWLLFCAETTAEARPYIQVFMEALPEGVYDFWHQSVGWPGFPAPRTAGRLLEHVEKQAPATPHHYTAYPEASPNDVRAALRVRREAVSWWADLRTEGLDGFVPPGDAQALLSRVQHCLGPTTGGPADVGAGQPRGTIGGLVALFPLRPDREDEVALRLERLQEGVGSPFARVPGTHFARLGVLDRHDALRAEQGTSLRSSYLLLAADADLAADRFLAALWQAFEDEDHSPWPYCRGVDAHTDAAGFVELGRRCLRPVLLEFLDYPGASLERVRRALQLRRELGGPLVSAARGEHVDVDVIDRIVALA